VLTREDFGNVDGFAMRSPFVKPMDELRLMYAKPDVYDRHVEEVMLRLRFLYVYVTPTLGRPLGCHEGGASTKHELVLPTGEKVTADYYDGMWEADYRRDKEGNVIRAGGHPPLVWRRESAHAMVFEHKGFCFGIRAPRTEGVDLAELLRVSSSVRFPVIAADIQI
jgi:hypothetical protein